MRKTDIADIGIYVHIPFCIRKCNYCDFCSLPTTSDIFKDEYCEEICRRMRSFSADRGKRRATSVYFGGGTPTLLPIECFETIFVAIKECFNLDENAEITVECNPATVTDRSLAALRALGVNRLSIGVQSASDKELAALGRLHSFDEFCHSFFLAREAGFDNISVDLMYGIPEQTVQSFENTLLQILKLEPEHISAYGLKIEEGTPFAQMRETLSFPDEDQEFEMYVTCRKLLEANGYRRYEISNFAKSGRESKHNLRYWRGEEYIGFGVAAHSFVDGERFGNSRDVLAFLRGDDIVCESESISDSGRTEEYVMLGLRLGEGISEEEYRKMSGVDIYDAMPSLKMFIKEGFLVCENGRIAFSDKGFFLSNSILCELLS